MLNPSKADAMVDDPTIRRCVGFGNHFGYRTLLVVNLFGFRATEPLDLLSAAYPVGSENAVHLRRALDEGAHIICAWGTQTNPKLRKLMNQQVRALAVLARGKPLWCLGTTKNSSPRHPLYVAADKPLEEFDIFNNVL
jgi:hypothetical protein